MPDLLLELFSEEIPARMQAQAAKDLERLIVGALSDRGLLFEGAKAFAGPRRLTLAISGLPAKQPDVSEELKGPKVDAPPAALDGFLRKTGLTKEQLRIEKTPKGDVYLAVIARAGRATEEMLAEILPECFAKLPWPKSMRFPDSPVRWVRPLHGIVCTFDGEVVPFEFAGVTSGNTTRGHRFLSKGLIEVRRFEDYEKKLRDAHVVLDAKERRDIIRNALARQAFALGLEPIEDEGLLDEVAGLAEWPVVLIGSIPDEFMDLPPEILRTSMRAHQKYFSLRYPPLQSGGGGSPRRGETEGARLAPKFAMVANMVARDGGKEIVAGNERVLRARLSDAKFFWDQDRKRTLESRVEDLKGVVFHAKLGTQHERVERIVALAGEIAAKIGADVGKAKRAALLCKADLTTGMVGEFPELQGVMGSYYALHDGEDVEVADAVRDHYKPVGPSDAVPTNKISVAVAIADKMDQLVGFFAVDERPTGSGDPYALRRAALGMIRLILSLQLRLRYREILLLCFWESVNSIYRRNRLIVQRSTSKQFELFEHLLPRERIDIRRDSNLQNNDAIFVFQGELDLSRKRDAAVLLQAGRPSPETLSFSDAEQVNVALMDFLADRLKVALREKGTRHDLIDAVFSLGSEDDLVRLVARVEALQTFLKTDDGANLLTAYRRAANILKAEEKKDKTTFDGEPDASLLALPEEKALGEALASASKSIAADVAAEKFVEAMGVMAKLRTPVDAFFDKVTVNDKNPKLRENRLRLLARLRATLHQVADFSKIEG